MTTNTDVSIECHEDHVPESGGPELDRLYGNIDSSLLHFQLNGGLKEAHTYVARRGQEALAVFLFKINGRKVSVLNKGMILSGQEIDRFATAMFTRFPAVRIIEFHDVHAGMEKSSMPYQRFCYNEDYVLKLPGSTEAYLAMLGSTTRKNLNKYQNRWRRAFPDFEFRVVEGEQIQEQQLQEVVVFNHKRMAVKNQTSLLDEEEVRNLLYMAKQCGLLCLTLVNGRICAGTLLLRFGDNFVSRVTSYDTRYDDYRLGTLARYWAICECIRRGGRDFRFMYGRHAFKSALGGVFHELSHVVIYRSYWHLLCQLPFAASTAYKGYKRQAKIWLLEKNKQAGTVPSMAHLCLEALNILKRMRQGKAIE